MTALARAGALLTTGLLLALTPITPAQAKPADTHDQATTTTRQRAVADYWTPARMRAAQPLELRASRPPRAGNGPDGTPLAVPPTAGPSTTDDVTALDFPNGGSPWTGGGRIAPTEGRVFFTYQGRTASCSGTAVTSNNRSTVITAGHCVKLQGSWHTNWMFAPAYRDGATPYGKWTARRTLATALWAASENINYDVGAGVVNPLNGVRLVDRVGGQGVAFNQSRIAPMYAFGYPAASPYDGSRLIYCSGNTFNDFLFTRDIGMTCNMTGGASGGGWLRGFNESTGTGTVNGVNSIKYTFFPNWMFSPYFGPEARDLYQQAQTT